ncbi:IDEAL domain-containing protein [Pseudalkalibacillus caeni]|uniref:IDEAL domain-containing protein n=1 Tax=Exobacillus caeni TaxID=2574798 RepID=A0A5R9F574_9BACL|nr:IDEAL domain-containing protein [Pseudalkalibacillus caeni]TLS37496.1 IDEAL domain-containing protein [Pseudalkalibacillus caeni]
MKNNNNSYKDNMKERAMLKKKKREAFTLELTAQLVLDEALFLFQKKRYEQMVDEALLERNKNKFMEVTKEYNKFMKQYKQHL